MPSILYNAGRVISYIVIGEIVGALGSAVSFTPGGKGVIAGIAGVFMVIMGLNMRNLSTGDPLKGAFMSSNGLALTGYAMPFTGGSDSTADISGCNSMLVISEYNLEKQLEPRDYIIEFTPAQSGVVLYSCWMGMIRSQITVVDILEDPSLVPQGGSDINNSLPSCCGGSKQL